MDSTGSAGVPIDGHEVKRRRGLQGDTNASLAKKAKVSPAYISHIECLRRLFVSPPVFVRICNALGLRKNERHLLMRQADRQAVAS